MTDFKKLRKEAEERRSIFVKSKFGEVPGSIPYLEGLIDKASSLDEKHLIFALILSECAREDNPVIEVEFLRRQMLELPLQPIFLASLASALIRIPGSMSEALARSKEAVELANSENRQLRYCLTCRVRLALSVGDYDAVSEALHNLIADAGQNRAEDSSYEFDFLDLIDERKVDPELLRQYKELAYK